MSAGNYNIVRLTEVLYRAMAGVSKNVFTTNRPKVHSRMTDFIVVSFPNMAYDNLGVGNTSCVIELHVRDTANGQNLPRLSALQDEIYSRIPIDNDICTIHSPRPVNAGADDVGFHAILIYCEVTIK